MPSANSTAFSVAVIGGGPAGLMAAEVLSQRGVQVDLFDAMPSLGRKFLLAGVGGMNITHSEAKEKFLRRYGSRQPQITALLNNFDAHALREWIYDLGINTFVGSSGRVFPTDMKAAPLLRAWLHRLREQRVIFHTRHRWLGWEDSDYRRLRFATLGGEITHRADAVVLALGGGSWAKLGSDGAWVPLLQQRGVAVAPLKPANCGFDIAWSAYFRERFAGQPLKSIIATVVDDSGTVLIDCNGTPLSQKGECVVTSNGIEGGVIYSLSAPLREQILSTGKAHLQLDLAPDRTLPDIVAALKQPRGSNSLANHLRKRLNISGIKAALLREIANAHETANPHDFANSITLAARIKSLPIVLRGLRPLNEAISSAGGVCFEALDTQLMLRAMPGIFCAGEMLDWEAPTGGYLLTACFASGRSAGNGVLVWLQNSDKTA